MKKLILKEKMLDVWFFEYHIWVEGRTIECSLHMSFPYKGKPKWTDVRNVIKVHATMDGASDEKDILKAKLETLDKIKSKWGKTLNDNVEVISIPNTDKYTLFYKVAVYSV